MKPVGCVKQAVGMPGNELSGQALSSVLLIFRDRIIKVIQGARSQLSK